MKIIEKINIDEQMRQIESRLQNEKGITLDEFKAFFFFLNNLEDFSKGTEWIDFFTSIQVHQDVD